MKVDLIDIVILTICEPSSGSNWFISSGLAYTPPLLYTK